MGGISMFQMYQMFQRFWKIPENELGESSMFQMYQMFQRFLKISDNEWGESSMFQMYQMFQGFWKMSEDQMGGKRWCSKCNVSNHFEKNYLYGQKKWGDGSAEGGGGMSLMCVSTLTSL